ncbi:MAG: hypothetical protein H0V44_02620 [Planctomycetes bacterium]|nr:hypothetical protein [Planctomycetota bacterium]
MGFFGGKKKDDKGKEGTGRQSAGAGAGSGTVRKSKRIIAPGGAKPAPPEPQQAAPQSPPVRPAQPQSRGAPAQQPPSKPMQPPRSAPLPPPPAGFDSSPTPARPQSKAPIQGSRPPEFAGDLTASRKTGPSRTGDAALMEFLKTKANLVSEDQAGQIKSKAQKEGLPVDIAAVQLGIITEDQMVNALTQECWVPHLKVDKYEIRKKALDTISRDDAMHYGVFPVDKLGSLLTLAMVNPLDVETIRVLESKTSLDIKKVVATRTEITQGIEKYYSGQVQAKEGSIGITQDVEPKSVTQMLAGVPSAPDRSQSRPSAPMPSMTADANITSDIQDIDDLLSSDEAIAPSIIEPISLKAEDIEIIPDAPELMPELAEPGLGEFDLEDTSAVTPQPPAPKPALAPEFELDDAPSAAQISRPAPAIVPPARKPVEPAARPAAAGSQRGAPPKPATSRFTSKGEAKPGLINLVPVMEEEFQHAITHGKSHVFEKWVGLQSRNRIINAVAVENELEPLLTGLYASPVRA